MKKFFNHQSVVITQDPKKTGLWLGTGGGKTRIALALARGKTLIICPKTQKLDQNWERECHKMREAGIKLKITHDTHPTNRANNLKQGHAMPTVMSKEEFKRDFEDSEKMGGFYNTIIVDEAETCLGVTPNLRQRKEQLIPKASQTYEALAAYVKLNVPDRLYLCTATITRSPMTVWAAGTLLGKKWDWYKWRWAFYTKLPMPGREVWTPKSTEECKDRLAKAVQGIGFVGRLEDWFDVPPQIYKNDYVELTAPQQKRIKELKIEYPDPIVALGKRLQVENGVLTGDEFSPSEKFSNKKMERILKYAEEFPRMIIWAKFTQQINDIKNELESKGYTAFTLTGQIKDKARAELFSTLENTDKAILVAQVKISAGWEWKKCPVMVFASRDYGIDHFIQGQGRIQRTDEIKSNMYINLIAREGVDEAVHESLENKKDFSERVYCKL